MSDTHQVEDFGEMEQVEQRILGLMRVRHRISAFRPDDFTVQSQRELIDTQLAAADQLGFLVSWIAFSVLIVAGLGILAITWIAVRDRTNEIGTRRALGATAPDIFFQFAFEAIVLATAGVLAGLLLGWTTTGIITTQMNLPLVFDRGNALLALSTALVLNFVFASWPAVRAARLDPILALQHE